MKGGARAKEGLKPIECKYCGNDFTPTREKNFVCRNKECKKAYNKEYNKRTKDKERDKNKMAEWRRKNPAKKLLSNLKQRNNIDIDEEWIQERLDKGVCEATGIAFEFPERYGYKSGFNHYPWNPSVDKIDPEMGYRKDNCQLVVWAYNRAKGLWSDEVMVKLGKGICDVIARKYIS